MLTEVKRFKNSGLVVVTLLLGLGIVIVFWQIFFLGYVQVPADIPPFYDPAMRVDPAQVVGLPQNPLLSDHAYQFYVWHYLAAEAMQATGRIPLWNPYLLAGQPLVANAQPALFYLPNLLLFWLDPGSVANVRVIFNIFIAGLFTFLFARSLGISKTGAILTAVAFAFSGTIIVGPGHAYANSLVWLPFVMWATEKMLQQTRIFFWGLVMSIGVALSILGGHPESTFHNILTLFLYFIARLFFLRTMPRAKLTLIFSFVMAIVVGVMLGAVQWLPFANWLRQSSTTSRSAAWLSESIFYTKEWVTQLPTLVTLLFPGFYGHPVEYTYRWPFPSFQNFLEQSMYFGLIPVALAVGAIFAARGKKRTRLIIIVALALFFLAVALRLPGFEVINHLPIFDRVNNTRLKWYFSFLGAILAGFGFDALVQYFASGKSKNKGVFRLTVLMLGIALGIVTLIVMGKWLGMIGWEIPTDSFTYHLLFNIFSWQKMRTAVSILVVIVGTAVFMILYRRPKLFPVLGVVLIFLTFVELIVLAYGYNTTVPRETVFPQVRFTQELAQDPEYFRVMGIPPTLWPNYGAVYGMAHVGGYDLPVYRRYSDVYEAQGGTGYRQTWSPDWPLVDWMNVKYFIGIEEQNLGEYELVFAENYRVYENKDVLPRAYLVYEAEILDDDKTILQTLTSGTFEFGQKVILENELPQEQMTAINSLAKQTLSGLDAVEIMSFNNDEVVLDVFTESPGILVMSDVFAPGWKAFVDGEEETIHRANYAFRAVFVPAGKHQITFIYQPLDFQVGRFLSMLGLALLFIGLPLLWVKKW